MLNTVGHQCASLWFSTIECRGCWRALSRLSQLLAAEPDAANEPLASLRNKRFFSVRGVKYRHADRKHTRCDRTGVFMMHR